MKIAVNGGTGFVGRTIARLFREGQVRNGLPAPGRLTWRGPRCCSSGGAKSQPKPSKWVFFEMP
jgi:hypothetical protein